MLLKHIPVFNLSGLYPVRQFQSQPQVCAPHLYLELIGKGTFPVRQ